MLEIHGELMAGEYPNCSGLAKRLGMARKTVQRDIDFMRDRLGLPIDYDRERHGFFYFEEVRQFPTVQVSDGELVALLVSQKAAEQYRGTVFEKPLQTAFQKLSDGLQGTSGVGMQELAEAISFRPQGLAVSELESFQTLARAAVRQHEVEFTYLGLHRTESERRRVRPYHIGCMANQWYLIGHDLNRDGIRTFALTRLSDARDCEKRFERPEGFSPDDFLKGSFSVFQAGTVERVVLRMSGFAARLAGERQWHASQRIEQVGPDVFRLTLDVGVAPDLENWILAWGAEAEVLEPGGLREKIASTARAMCARYGG